MHEQIKNKLIAVAKRFVDDARSIANFTDRTGNLRSSIGALIAHNGKVIYRNFEKSERGTDKATGMQTAREIAESKISEYPPRLCSNCSCRNELRRLLGKPRIHSINRKLLRGDRSIKKSI